MWCLESDPLPCCAKTRLLKQSASRACIPIHMWACTFSEAHIIHIYVVVRNLSPMQAITCISFPAKESAAVCTRTYTQTHTHTNAQTVFKHTNARTRTHACAHPLVHVRTCLCGRRPRQPRRGWRSWSVRWQGCTVTRSVASVPLTTAQGQRRSWPWPAVQGHARGRVNARSMQARSMWFRSTVQGCQGAYTVQTTPAFPDPDALAHLPNCLPVCLPACLPGKNAPSLEPMSTCPPRPRARAPARLPAQAQHAPLQL